VEAFLLGISLMNNNELYITDSDYLRLLPITKNHPLADELARAIVVTEEIISSNIVRINSKVTYMDESVGVTRVIELVLPEEVDLDHGKISVLAPVGTALFGLKEGHSIEWSFPNGKLRKLRVVSAVAPNNELA
jgi:regulator of nucleoside diphosphate kinase